MCFTLVQISLSIALQQRPDVVCVNMQALLAWADTEGQEADNEERAVLAADVLKHLEAALNVLPGYHHGPIHAAVHSLRNEVRQSGTPDCTSLAAL